MVVTSEALEVMVAARHEWLKIQIWQYWLSELQRH